MFAEAGDHPVAIALAGTEFGKAPYIGSLMLGAAAGQTMADAYDAVIHLGPMDGWQHAADYVDMYTPEFRREVARRHRAAYPPDDWRSFWTVRAWPIWARSPANLPMVSRFAPCRRRWLRGDSPSLAA